MQNSSISRVKTTEKEVKETYDTLSRFYDLLPAFSEQRYIWQGLKLLEIERGEHVLEIGFGTGKALEQLATAVGAEGKVYGIDISSGMMEVSKKRLRASNLLTRVELYCGNALNMPYKENKFDAVFMSFTLELFDTPEIPEVLHNIKRVLKSKGRLGVVSLSKKEGNSFILRVYELLHRRFPRYLDCRPIYVEKSIKEAGFIVTATKKIASFGIPVNIVIGRNSA